MRLPSVPSQKFACELVGLFRTWAGLLLLAIVRPCLVVTPCQTRKIPGDFIKEPLTQDTRVLPLILAGVCLLGSLAPVAATSDNLYRWVDAQGHAHFSDQPQGDAQPFDPHLPQVNGDKPPSSDAGTVDAKACSQRRAELARYLNASSITETDSLGKVHTYTADERRQLIARTRAAVASACGPAQDDSPAGDSSTGNPVAY